MAIDLVIFDCDGVLFHSEEANVAFYNEVLRRAGEREVSRQAEIACHTLASAQLFATLFVDRPETLERVRRIAQEVDYGPFYDLMRPRARLRETLASLGTRYRLAMATNRGKTTMGVLERFDLREYFELAVGVLDVERLKPHPDMLERCLAHFGVGPQQAIYVGDQEIDAVAASAAGLGFVAMGSGVADAQHRVFELGELSELIERM